MANSPRMYTRPPDPRGNVAAGNAEPEATLQVRNAPSCPVQKLVTRQRHQRSQYKTAHTRIQHTFTFAKSAGPVSMLSWRCRVGLVVNLRESRTPIYPKSDVQDFFFDHSRPSVPLCSRNRSRVGTWQRSQRSREFAKNGGC